MNEDRTKKAGRPVWKTGLVLLLGLLLLAGIGGAMYPKIIGLKYRSDILRSCSVTTGGGMLGGGSSVTLSTDENGEAILTVRERENHADREITTVYRADPAAFDRLRELVNRHDLFAASKRRRSRIQVLDGDTISVSFDYGKGGFAISDNQVLSRRMAAGFREAQRLLPTFAVGEGVRTVETAFDGKLETALGEEHETARFGDAGIVLNDAAAPDTTDAEPKTAAAAGEIVYDPQSGQILLLYADHDFETPVYLLAAMESHVDSACPLIAEMEGQYMLYLN